MYSWERAERNCNIIMPCAGWSLSLSSVDGGEGGRRVPVGLVLGTGSSALKQAILAELPSQAFVIAGALGDSTETPRLGPRWTTLGKSDAMCLIIILPIYS